MQSSDPGDHSGAARLHIAPLSPALGARVEGVDLAAPLAREDGDAVLEAWRRFHLLVFPAQRLTPDEQVAFCRRFGTVQAEGPDGASFNRVSNLADTGILEESRISFHVDFSFVEHPVEAICLYAEALPASGTRTSFASNARPLHRLSMDRRRALAELAVRNVADFANPQQDIVRYRAGRAPESAIAREMPLVQRHPRFDVDVLACCHQQTERILALADDESARLLDELFDELLYADGNVYEHEWREGDLVIWDNLAIQHGRPAAPLSAGERTLRRVTVSEKSAVAQLMDALAARGQTL